MSLRPPLETAKAKATPQRVRALLRKAGFAASKTRTTRIRGWHHWSPGSEVRVRGDLLIIDWNIGSSASLVRGNQAAKDRMAKIEAMRQVLLDAGIVAALETDDWGNVKLTVRQ